MFCKTKILSHDDEELSLHDDASLDGSVPASNKGDAPAKPPQIITTNTLSNIKLPVLQKDDYDTWAMEMEHYLEFFSNHTEEQVAEEKERKAKEPTARGLFPKDHSQTFFNGKDDAKESGVHHQDKESLEKGYDRFQKLLSQLDALGAGVSDEDANHKFLRSLPPAWDSLAMTMRTKKNIDTLSIDDPQYNNKDFLEQEHPKTIIFFPFIRNNVASLFTSQSLFKQAKAKPPTRKLIVLIPLPLQSNTNLAYSYSYNALKAKYDELQSEFGDQEAALTAHKLGLGYGIQSNAEVLGYEEEMSRGIFVLRETDPGYYDIPLYSRFKQVEYKGVPHPLSVLKCPNAVPLFSIHPFHTHDIEWELGNVSGASSTHYSNLSIQ
ncbi:hypothetical protein Tco_1360613 [Tanacetum coccineum]